MTPQDIQSALKTPLVNNMGNKLTPELIAGLLVSLSDSMIKLLGQDAVNHAAQPTDK